MLENDGEALEDDQGEKIKQVSDFVGVSTALCCRPLKQPSAKISWLASKFGSECQLWQRLQCGIAPREERYHGC